MSGIPCVDLKLEYRFIATKLAGGDLLAGAEINAEDLCSPQLREIYRAARHLDMNEEGWGTESVLRYLEAEKKLGSVVTSDYVLEVALAKNDIEFNVEPMVDRLRTMAKARRKYEVLQDAQVDLINGDYGEADRKILSIADQVTLGSDSKIYSASGLAQVTRDAVESMKGGKRLVIPTGIQYLDRFIGGLFPGGMFTIAGYSSTGKSQVALLIAKNVAESGYPVGIISVEDPALITGSRLVSQITGQISSKNIFVGDYAPDRLDRIIATIDEHKDVFAKLPLHVAVCTTATTSDVVDTAIKLIKEKQCKVIALDYIQRVRVDVKANRYDKMVSDVSKQLKGLCGRYDVSLVMASQLTNYDGNIYKRPHPNQMRETKDLWQESEVMIMLWDEKPEAGSDTLFWIAKGKIGNKGITGRLVLHPITGMIVDMKARDDDKGSEGREKRDSGVFPRSHNETSADYD